MSQICVVFLPEDVDADHNNGVHDADVCGECF